MLLSKSISIAVSAIKLSRCLRESDEMENDDDCYTHL